jgi:hypothetical protein
MVNDWNTIQRTGNPAVDMVADHIYYYRRHLRPVKTITLSPRAFDKFAAFVRRQVPDLVPGQKFEFDGVMIEKGSPLMIKDLMTDFWPMSAGTV